MTINRNSRASLQQSVNEAAVSSEQQPSQNTAIYHQLMDNKNALNKEYSIGQNNLSSILKSKYVEKSEVTSLPQEVDINSLSSAGDFSNQQQSLKTLTKQNVFAKFQNQLKSDTSISINSAAQGGIFVPTIDHNNIDINESSNKEGSTARLATQSHTETKITKTSPKSKFNRSKSQSGQL